MLLRVCALVDSHVSFVSQHRRRAVLWLPRKVGLRMSRKRVPQVMPNRGLLVRSRRPLARRKKESARVIAAEPNQI
jgi:hypothetical protein